MTLSFPMNDSPDAIPELLAKGMILQFQPGTHSKSVKRLTCSTVGFRHTRQPKKNKSKVRKSLH